MISRGLFLTWVAVAAVAGWVLALATVTTIVLAVTRATPTPCPCPCHGGGIYTEPGGDLERGGVPWS